MQTRTKNALAASVVLGLAAAGLGLAVRARDQPQLAASASASPAMVSPGVLPVPAGALVVARVDWAALHATPLGPALGTDAVGGPLRERCGADPLEQVDELVVAVPASGEAGDFGLVGRGAKLDAAALLACAR